MASTEATVSSSSRYHGAIDAVDSSNLTREQVPRPRFEISNGDAAHHPFRDRQCDIVVLWRRCTYSGPSWMFWWKSRNRQARRVSGRAETPGCSHPHLGGDAGAGTVPDCDHDVNVDLVVMTRGCTWRITGVLRATVRTTTRKMRPTLRMHFPGYDEAAVAQDGEGGELESWKADVIEQGYG